MARTHRGSVRARDSAHASGTAALLPMLALGIPGSGTAAILLGGLMVWGLNPGPLLFVEHKDFVWGLIASMYLGNVVGLVLVLTTVPIFASILRVPFAAVAPMIVVSCAIGAYAIQNAMFDIWLMLGFGVVGYVFKKIGIPLAQFHAGARARQPRRGCLPPVDDGSGAHEVFGRTAGRSITTLAIVLLFWPVIDWAFGSITRMLRRRRRSGLMDALPSFERSAAIHASTPGRWIASSRTLLAMTEPLSRVNARPLSSARQSRFGQLKASR